MKAKYSRTINRCQISNSKDLKSLVFLGYLPPVNTLRKINSKISEEIFFPAEMLFSEKSKLAQLGCIVDKKILFPKIYLTQYYKNFKTKFCRFI